jgi:hypothetical protein
MIYSLFSSEIHLETAICTIVFPATNGGSQESFEPFFQPWETIYGVASNPLMIVWVKRHRLLKGKGTDGIRIRVEIIHDKERGQVGRDRCYKGEGTFFKYGYPGGIDTNLDFICLLYSSFKRPANGLDRHTWQSILVKVCNIVSFHGVWIYSRVIDKDSDETFVS